MSIKKIIEMYQEKNTMTELLSLDNFKFTSTAKRNIYQYQHTEICINGLNLQIENPNQLSIHY